MKSAIFALLITYVSSVLAGYADIIPLNYDNFHGTTKSSLASGESWFIRFHAKWCQASKNMEKAWRQINWNMLDNKSIRMGDIDIEGNPELVQAYGAYSYPTLYLLRKKKAYKYPHHLKTAELLEKFARIDYLKVKPVPIPEIPKRITEHVEVESKYVDKVLFTKKSKSIELTETSFSRKTKKGAWLSYFYASWSPECHKTAGTWSEIAAELKEENSSVYVSHFECNEDSKVPLQYSIMSFPAVVLLQNGKYVSYDGAITKEGIKDFLSKNLEIAEEKVNEKVEL